MKFIALGGAQFFGRELFAAIIHEGDIAKVLEDLVVLEHDGDVAHIVSMGHEDILVIDLRRFGFGDAFKRRHAIVGPPFFEVRHQPLIDPARLGFANTMNDNDADFFFAPNIHGSPPVTQLAKKSCRQ